MRGSRGQRRHDDGRGALPPQWQVNAASTLYAVQRGDQHIHHCHHDSGFSLRVFADVDRGDPADLGEQPSQLLLARNQVVGFMGRSSELDKLQQWRQSTSRASVRLLHGPGGVGKTRLGAEFARLSTKAGWTVVVAQRGGSTGFSIGDIPADTAGRLIIVDYAERWPRTDLLALFSGVDAPRPSVTRVLMLARSATSWWGDLRNPLLKQGISVDAEQLADLASDAKDRQSLFKAACASFAQAYRTNASGLEPAGSLDDPRYRLVLTIHMAALAAVDAHNRGRRSPNDPGALSTYLLDRERDHWATMHESHRIATKSLALGRAVFLATLVGPMSRKVGVQLLREAELASDDATAQQILDDHKACYPPADDSTVLEPLAPDRLGEDFVARNMPHGNPDAFSDSWDWAPDVSSRILIEAAQSTHRPRAVTVLAEAGKRWRHVGRHLNDHLRNVPDQLVTIGGAALLAVANVADISLLSAIEPYLPDRDIDLDSAAARIIMRLTDHQLKRTDCQVTRAQLHVKRGWRLGNAGNYDQARQETERAVRVYRSLIDAAPGQHEPGLATALHNLGSHLAGLGLQEAAFAATREAADLREFLAKVQANVHEPELARTLDNLATDYLQMGSIDVAVATAERAVAIHRRLTKRFRAHEPALAASLHNLGMHLAHARRWRDAIEITQQAVHLYQSLANRDAARYEADLAATLHDLGSYQHELGWPAQSAKTTKTAVQIRSRLADTNPARFKPDLAQSLLSLANDFSDLGLHGLAERMSVQAVDLSWDLAAKDRDRYDANLATVLHGRAIHLARMSERSEALDAAEQAVNIRSRLTETCVTSYESRLYDALREVGVVVHSRVRLSVESRLNGWEIVDSMQPKAQELAESATRRLQHAVDAIFAANMPGGAHSYENLGIRLFRADRLTVAAAAMAPTIIPQLVVPARILKLREAELARSLCNLSSRFAETNQPREALTSAEQAADAFRRLTAADPDEHRREFALSLANLGLCLADVGRSRDALTATGAAIAALGPSTGSEWSSTQAASILLSFAWIRRATRTELDAGLYAARRASGIYRELLNLEPESFASKLRSTMQLESDILLKLGRRSESIDIRHAMNELPKPVLNITPNSLQPVLLKQPVSGGSDC